MKMTRLSPDDPKLTAYALGELDASEAAQVAAAIQGDAAARAAVEEIRSLAGQLQDALENEPIVASPTSPVLVEAAAPSKVFHFPVYWISGLAAACLLVVLATHRQSEKLTLASAEQVKTTATAVDAAPAPSALPVADMRKRALAPAGSDVSPAPLREDGLKMWRTVADAGEPANDPARNQVSNTVHSALRKAEAVGPTAPHDSTYGGVAQSTGSVRAPQDYSPSLDYGLREVSDESESSRLASVDSHDRDLLQPRIAYTVPSMEARNKIELPTIGSGTGSSIASKDFKFASAFADLGLWKAPRKGAVRYDQILTWAQDGQEDKQEKTADRRDTNDVVKKTKDMPVE